MPSLYIFLGLLSLLGANTARAEAVFLAGEVGGVPAKKVVIPVKVGQKVRLDARFFTLEEGSAARELEDPDGSFEWHVRCDEHAAECPQDNFEVADHGRLFEVPGDSTKVIYIIVTHAAPDGTEDAEAEIQLQLGPASRVKDAYGAWVPPHSSLHEKAAPVHIQERQLRMDEPEEGANLSKSSRRSGAAGYRGATAQGGSAGTSSGTPETSPTMSLSRPAHGSSAIDAAFDHYYSDRFDDYAGGASGPDTTARGYNRESEVPVLSCASVRGADGAMHVVCEGESKELRVHAPDPKPAKKTPAKKKRKKAAVKIPAKRKSPPS